MDTPDPQPPTIEDDTTDHTDDVAAIRQVIADVETGFNTNDAELAAKHFSENASVVTAVGTEITGRAAVLEHHRVGLAGPLADERAAYELSDVGFLRPDVAIAHKHAWVLDADGARTESDHAMVALYVLVREQGRWWVASRQNTLVGSFG